MKNVKLKKINRYILSLIILIGFSLSAKSQDYNDIGRTKEQEFESLKFNGYKVTKVESREDGVETYLAKRSKGLSNYDNYINISTKTGTVVGVIWNFSHKNFTEIKSLLSDMTPTDSSFSEYVNNKGVAKITKDQNKDGYGLVIWNKRTQTIAEIK